MGWTNFPPITKQATANSWIWHDQIRQAMQEKYDAAMSGVSYFPRTPHVWAQATITAQGEDDRGWYIDFDTALTCNNFDPALINPGTVGHRGNVDHFAVVVNNADPKKCVRLGSMNIGSFPTDHGTTSTRLYLTPPPANHPDYLDYEAVVGKTFYIISGYGVDEDPWWHERWMQPPNNVITAVRTVHEDPDNNLTCTPGVLIDTKIKGKAASYKDQHLWIDTDRFTITAIDDHSITFANPNIDPLPTLVDGQSYIVIHADGFYKPNNEFFCWRWHDVPNESWYAHEHTLIDTGPNAGQVSTTNLRAQTVRVIEPDGDGNCPLIGEPHDITETDVWVAMVNWCEDPDTTKTPHLYRTIRGIQLATVEISQSFVKNQDYTGSAAIPLYVPATWFVDAGINVLTLTGTTPAWSSGEWRVSVNASDFDDFPDGALDDDGVWWALIDTTWGNTVIASGRAYIASDIPASITVPCDIPHTAASGGNPEVHRQFNTTSDPYEYGTPHTVAWVCSAGWTRKHPAEFKYAYERTGFVPEQYTENVGDPPVATHFVADPPTSDHPGTYDTRPASDHLTHVDTRGQVQESSLDYEAITDGVKARYLGDNTNDPGLTETNYFPPVAISRRSVLVESGDHDDGTLVPRLWYADQFRETIDFQKGNTTVVTPNPGDGGTATGGGTTFLTDTSKNWWPQGTLITHTGTAADGGATTLTTSASDGFWTQFIDGVGRFQGRMAVEVHVRDDDEGNEVWEKRLISFHSNSDLSWVEPMSVLTGGKDFKIAEPKGRCNYWKGRTVTLTSPDGNTVFEDVPIIGSDNDTIFFDEQDEPVGKGWTYQIYEMMPGAVYQRAGGKWVLPDEAKGGDAKSKNVHPDTLTRYGYARKRDYVGRTLYSELRTGLDLLTATLGGGIIWDRKGEENHKTTADQDTSAVEEFYADAVADVNAAVAAGFAENFHIDASPMVQNVATASADGDFNSDGRADQFLLERDVERIYSYAHKTDLITKLPGSVDFYTFADDWGESTSTVDSEFEAYGDPVLARQWKKFDTEAIGSDVYSIKFGGDTDPGNNIPAEPAIGVTVNRTSGYQISNTQTVCRWTMDFHAD